MSLFEIATDSIDRDSFRASLTNVSCGACVVFEGWVRDHNEGRRVLRLAYEVYEPLAIKEGKVILAEAFDRFEIQEISAIHRHGELALSEPAVVVGVSSAHRDAAFQACRFVIDEVKARLPIWKKEYYADGTSEWVNCKHCAHSFAHRQQA
jgi:molybdopterin synthase catalytic subunit